LNSTSPDRPCNQGRRLATDASRHAAAWPHAIACPVPPPDRASCATAWSHTTTRPTPPSGRAPPWTTAAAQREEGDAEWEREETCTIGVEERKLVWD
jgi:hypothetical protein